MLIKNIVREILLFPLKLFFTPHSNLSLELINPNIILIIWTNASFGILLSSRSFFLALRRKYPSAQIKLIVNSTARNNFINSKLTYKTFFDEVISISELRKLRKALRKPSEISISPTLEKFHFRNYLISRIAKTQARIGVAQFNEISNPYSFLLNKKINLDLSKTPDIHISQMLFEFLKQFGDFGEPENFYLRFNVMDARSIKSFKSKLGFQNDKKIVIININSEDDAKKISIEKFIEIFKGISLVDDFQYCIVDKNNSSFHKFKKEISAEDIVFLQKNDIRNLFNLLNFANLAITCDSEFMHIAGVVDIPQISIFGSSNPFNFAPLGNKKIFVKSSEIIDELDSSQIIDKAKIFLLN